MMTQATQTQGAASPPSGWVETTLGEIVKTNLSSISRDYPFDEILYLDTGSITENRIESLQKIKTKDAPSRAKRILQPNDIVYSNVRPVQKHFGVIENPQDNLVASTGFTTITTNIDKAFPKFIYYLISQDSAINFFQQIAEHSTSAYPSIRPEHIESFVINLPPLPEQRAIAGVLSAFDDKIELLREQNKTLEATAQAIFGEWFGKYSPDRPEELPEGWRVGKIEDLVLKMNSGGTPSTKQSEYYGKGYNWFSTKEFQDNFLFASEKTITKDGLNNSSAKLFPANTVLMAIYAAPTVGRLAILTQESTFNQAAVGLVADENLVNYGFIYLLLKTLRNDFNNLANGAAQQNLNVGLVRNFPIIIPAKKILQKFDGLVQPMFEKIRENSQQIQTLSTFRDTLLPRLMRGEVRVGF